MKPSRALPTLFSAALLACSAQAGVATTPLSDRCLGLSAADPAAALKLVQAELPQQKDAAGIAALRLCRGHALWLGGEREQAADDYQFAVAEAERLRDSALLASAGPAM